MVGILRIEWRDLLAVPFRFGGEDAGTGLDCWGQARVIARRAGFYVPEWPTRWRDDPSRTMTPALEYVGPVPSCATHIADLLVSDPEELGWPSHVATIIDERTRHALSTSGKYGPYTLPAARHPCTYGVWRPKIRLDAEEVAP